MAKKNGVELAKAYVQIIPSMEGAQSAIEQALNGGGGVGDIGSRAGDTLGKALSSAFTKAAGFLKDSIETGMGFDSAMSQVAATMGKTVDEIAELRDYAKEMGATTAFSATQSAEALNYMALAGYDAETSMKMLPQVMDLAAAGGMELASASDMVTDSQTALGLSVEDTEKLVDQMAKTASTTNTSVSQLGDAILTVGGTAKNLAGGTDELNQVLGLMADNGIKAGEAGTHLRNIMLAMNPTTKDAKEAFDELNFSAYDSEGNLREMSDIFGELGSKLKEMTPQDRQSIIGKIFKVTDLAAVNALLDTTSERWDEVAEAIDNAGGAAAAMADTQMDNLAGDITLLKSAFEGLQIEISEELSEDLRGLVQVATEGITWLTDHSNLLIGVIGGIGAAAAAMNLPAVFTAAKTAVLALNTALTASPLFGLSVVLGSIVAISGAIDDMTEKINEIPDAFEGLDAGEVEFVKSVAEGTDDLAEANSRLEEAQKRLSAAEDARDATFDERKKAEEELLKIKESHIYTTESMEREYLLENEIIPQLTEKLNDQRAAVGALAQTKMDAQAQVNALTEAQEQAAEETEAATIAEQEQAIAEEQLAKQKEKFAESVKQSMKDALTVDIELNGKTVELARTTAESIGQIIDNYDAMYEKQRQVIESSFDLWGGFTADTSMSFDDLLGNLNSTKKGLNDWADSIEDIEKRGLHKGIVEQLKRMGEDGYKYVYAFAHASDEQLAQYSKTWEATQTTLSTVTDRMMETEKQSTEQLLAQFKELPTSDIEEIREGFHKAGLEGLKGYNAAVEEYLKSNDTAIDKLVDEQLKKLQSDETITEFKDMGKFLYSGLAQGMTDDSVLNELDTAVEVIVNRVVKKTQEGFKIQSPSKVFDEMGVYLPEGLAGGVIRGTDSAERAVEYMTNSVISSARDELTGAELGIDLGINAAALDRVASTADYRAADNYSYEAPSQKAPTTFIFTLDSHEVARATFEDINDMIGQTAALQLRGCAT